LSSSPAASQARVEARNNNKPYGISMITTPNSLEKEEAVWFLKEMIGRSCNFDENMYDWKLSEIKECIDKKSKNDFLYIEFSYKQLGRTDEWFREQCRALNNDLLLIRREILLEWTRASDVSVYSEEQLASIEKNLMTPVTSLTIRKFWKLEIYDDAIDFRKPYIIGCDPSPGTESDASAICIIDTITLKPLAEFRENKISTEDLKMVIYELMTKFFINSVLVMENNIGTTILDWLMRQPAVANRIYYEYKEKVASKLEYSKTEVTHKKVNKRVQVYGIVTESNSRNLMLEILDYTVNNEPELLATPFLYSDVKGLERNKKGENNYCPNLLNCWNLLRVL